MRLGITAFIAGGSLLFSLSSIPSSWLWISVLLTTIFSCFLYFSKPESDCRNLARLGLFVVLGFAWNAQYAENRLKNILTHHLEGKDLIIEGRIAALPQGGLNGVKFAFEIDSLRSSDQSLNDFPRKIYLSWQPAWRETDTILEIIPGQRWKLRVKLKQPYGSLNPYTFDFERWSFHQNFGAVGSVRSGELIHQKDIGFTEFELRMEYARWKLRNKIQSKLPSDARYAGVIIALVMGDQNAIHQKDWHTFNATGIGHLISISGLHVTMLAGMGALMASFLWRRRNWPLYIPVVKVAAISGFITAFVYAWLAGFQIPAQRTMYMVGVVAFALWTGRSPRSFDIWWWALAFVLLIDPMAPYTPGFWLSFGAVAAILYGMGNSQGLLGIPTGNELHHHWRQRLVEAFKVACRVQAIVTIALLPFTLFWFYQVSLISPLANAFAIPLVSYVVTPLAIAGAFLPDFLSPWLLIMAHQVMEHLASFLDGLAKWPWSVRAASQPEWWVLILSSVGIIYAIRPGVLIKDWQFRVLGLCLCTPLFVPIEIGSKEALSKGEFKATVLDIGQGTSVLVETASKKLLYDTGPILGKADNAGQRIILPYLRGRGMNQIDRLVISHGDSDHIGGANSLIQDIQFDSMMGSLPQTNPLFKTLKKKNIPSIPCRFGQHWIWDEVEFIVWHPHEETVFEDQHSRKPNEMSCVLEVRNQHHSFWLTGDVEKQGESEITERLDFEKLLQISDREVIFMAPHHGSKTSSSLGLLQKLEPNHAFSQSGYRNRYGHPHPIVLGRYRDLKIPLYQSPETGAQIWGFRKGTLQRQLWRKDRKRLWHRKPENIAGHHCGLHAC